MQEVNFSYSDLFKTKDDQLTPRCQNIHNAATTNIASLAPYGITAATVATLLTTINNYQSKVPDPRNAAAQKATIRINLKNLIKETGTILKLQMDKTAVGFKSANPDFYNTYKVNRIIIDPSKTTTALKGIITSSAGQTFVAGATIAIEGTTSKATTNQFGEYEIKPSPVGTFSITATIVNFNSKTLSGIIIKQGQINKQDISINPV